MAKRERNWQPDIYDMTAGRVRPAGKAQAVVESPVDAEALLEDDSNVVAPAGDLTDLASAPPVVVRVAAPARARGSSDNEALLGLVAGAVVGAALILLTAPSNGARLRAQLRGRLDTSMQGAANRAQALAQKMPIISASGPDTPVTGEQNQ